jgi:hypothetical protein
MVFLKSIIWLIGVLIDKLLQDWSWVFISVISNCPKKAREFYPRVLHLIVRYLFEPKNIITKLGESHCWTLSAES